MRPPLTPYASSLVLTTAFSLQPNLSILYALHSLSTARAILHPASALRHDTLIATINRPLHTRCRSFANVLCPTQHPHDYPIPGREQLARFLALAADGIGTYANQELTNACLTPSTLIHPYVTLLADRNHLTGHESCALLPLHNQPAVDHPSLVCQLFRICHQCCQDALEFRSVVATCNRK